MANWCSGTTNPAKGWDGLYNNRQQASGGYVWIAEGLDYLNKIIQKKGSTVLIR